MSTKRPITERSRRTRKAAAEVAPLPEDDWDRGIPEDRMDFDMNFGDAGLGIGWSSSCLLNVR